MPKLKSDDLFQLIKSLSKSEKRYCKLHMQQSGEDRKMLLLFDAIDQQLGFDEEAILARTPGIRPQQWSNLKAYLYDKILHCMRAYHMHKNKNIQTRAHLDHAQILFDRGLYQLCLKSLRRAKKLSLKSDNLELRLEILKQEKNVVALGIGNEDPGKVDAIIQEVKEVNTRINNINVLSNIQVRLNNWYVKTGFVRKEEYLEEVKQYFENNIPDFEDKVLSFNEKLNLYSVYVTYYLFIQDFIHAYQYALQWVALFEDDPEQIYEKTIMYIRGLNNLMICQNKLYKYYELAGTLQKLKAIDQMPRIELNRNIRAMLFKYTTIHEMNQYFLTGHFSEGVLLVARIEKDLDFFVDKLGKHATIIFYYKIACMYFGDSNHRMAAHWLQKIINEQQVDLRQDIHCFARILNLVSQYELGNTDIIDYYIKSTYRFLLQKDDLGDYQQYILRFLRNLSKETTDQDLVKRFEALRKQLLTLIHRPYEKRAFIYFDIISWLESKINKTTVQAVIREKAVKKLQQQRQYQAEDRNFETKIAVNSI